MKLRINTSVVSAVLMLLLAVGVWLAIPVCIKEFASATDIGPRAFPQLMCAAIAVLSALQLVLLATGVQKAKYREVDPADQLPVYAAMGLAIAAVLCALFVNVVAAGVACALLFLVLLKARNWRYYLAVLVTGGALYALMRFVMHIQF